MPDGFSPSGAAEPPFLPALGRAPGAGAAALELEVIWQLHCRYLIPIGTDLWTG